MSKVVCYNEPFADMMKKMGAISKGYRANAYRKAESIIRSFPTDLVSPDQLKGVAGIGPSILQKLQEFVDTGTIADVEQFNTCPKNMFSCIHGIGEVKSRELVAMGIRSLDELRTVQRNVLTPVQQLGLRS